MHVTLLGTGDALGVPAPLCGCRYCESSERRRRPGVLVETGEATVVLDAGPDLKDQFHETGTTDVDAVFLTHHHFDHVGGLDDLHHATLAMEEHVLNPETVAGADHLGGKSFALYASQTAIGHLADAKDYLAERLAPTPLDHGEAVEVGDLRVVPFPVEHARPQFDTLGFAASHGGSTLAYAPDVWSFLPEREAGQMYEGADLLVAEGSALFGAEVHGPRETLADALASADADRTVLVNVSEHLQRQSTAELAVVAEKYGYELGEDFATYELPA